MIEILGLPFMQRALLAAIISGLIAPSIGTYIVQRRMSLLGDGLGHVAIMGVGLAFLTGTAPLPVAVITCVVGAVVVELLRQSGKTSGDLGLAILFYGGLAAGVMMAGMAGQGASALSAFLFGSLTSVSTTDLWVIGNVVSRSQHGQTSGIIPFIRVMDSLTLAISQGSLRRGSAAIAGRICARWGRPLRAAATVHCPSRFSTK